MNFSIKGKKKHVCFLLLTAFKRAHKPPFKLKKKVVFPSDQVFDLSSASSLWSEPRPSFEGCCFDSTIGTVLHLRHHYVKCPTFVPSVSVDLVLFIRI